MRRPLPLLLLIVLPCGCGRSGEKPPEAWKVSTGYRGSPKVWLDRLERPKLAPRERFHMTGGFAAEDGRKPIWPPWVTIRSAKGVMYGQFETLLGKPTADGSLTFDVRRESPVSPGRYTLTASLDLPGPDPANPLHRATTIFSQPTTLEVKRP